MLYSSKEKTLRRMWQNSRHSSRSPWVQLLKDKMKRPARDPATCGKGSDQEVELDAETEILGDKSDDGGESGSSGIPDDFLGVADEPMFDGSEPPLSQPRPDEVRGFVTLVFEIVKCQFEMGFETVLDPRGPTRYNALGYTEDSDCGSDVWGDRNKQLVLAADAADGSEVSDTGAVHGSQSPKHGNSPKKGDEDATKHTKDALVLFEPEDMGFKGIYNWSS